MVTAPRQAALVDVAVVQNRAPLALADSVFWTTLSNVQIGPVGNDTDPDGDDLRLIDINTLGTDGTVSCQGSSCVYTPPDGYSGPFPFIDAFDYRITDDRGGYAWGTVTVNIEPNAPPDANDDVLNAIDTETAWINVVANDVDADADPLIVICED